MKSVATTTAASFTAPAQIALGEVSLGEAALSEIPVTTRLMARLADYATLGKPRIAVMSLVVVAAGYALGRSEVGVAAPLVHALIGIALVAISSSALNQVFERVTDGLMKRTVNRPLPAGRLSSGEALTFGAVCGVAGVGYLLAFVNQPTAVWSGITLVLYAFVYTPLKRVLPLATAIGAIPGAMPPVLGWLAAGRSIDVGAFALFGILFLWQFPHFLAIAWIYREDYARAGLKMLPTRTEIPRVTGTLAFAYSVALLPISLLPAFCGLAGRTYLVGALLLSLWYLVASLRFAFSEERDSARVVLRTSLVYLPALLALLVWDHYRLLG